MVKKYFRSAYLVFSILILLAILILSTQSATFQKSLTSVREANLGLVVIAALMVFSTYFAAALTLHFLSFKKLEYSETLLVQFASGFATKLVPAGIGGFAINSRYLTKHRYNITQATSIMSLNNLLGFIGHILIILICILLKNKVLFGKFQFNLPKLTDLRILLILAILLLIVLFLCNKLLPKILRGFKEILSIIKVYLKQPARLFKSFISALTITILFSGALYLSALSLGITLSPLEVLMVFTLGMVGVAISPTPGGIGGAEAAITAGLFSLGLSKDQALTIALTYRFVAYWLPILPGIIAFKLCINQKII